jgi:cytoskeleton protein RodZ
MGNVTESVGIELRRARERAHLSLHDLAARTKIRVPLLAAIEREDFEKVPAGLLTRGYLRAYAREVGLDPEAVVRQYVAEFEPERLPRVHEPPDPQETEWDEPPAARSRALLVPVIPLALAALFFLRVHRPDDTTPVYTPTPMGTVGQQVGIVPIEHAEPAAAADDVADAPAPVEGLRLEIHPTAPVWVEATADGTQVLYELVDAGQARSIDATDAIVLRIGDAAAFAYSINGRPGRALGGPGQVRDIRITRDNHPEFHRE